MADIQKLINTILTDPKLADSKNRSKVYQDEPILITAAQLENYTPPKYREMRKIAKNNSLLYESDAKIFYEQGKFMEDFEDDFNYKGEFIRYFPTYQAMSNIQLRGYFSWRTKVRRGIIEKTSLSFVFVYIYELLNQIGVNSPEKGFYKLKNFWAEYKKIDTQINYYIKLWLKDYVIYNNLDKSLLEDFSDLNFDSTVLTLLNYKSHSIDEIFLALNSLSSYNFENSRFFKQYPDDIKNIVYSVYDVLTDYYNKNRKNSICEKFFGRIYNNPYTMFKSAIFYHQANQKDFVYEINDIYKYSCKNGSWSNERFFCYKGKIQKIGELLKTIDFLMRQKYNFKSTLKVDKITKIYQEIINREIEKYLESKRKNTLPKIEIDVTRLHSIRQVALETQNKLIVEEGLTETDAPEIPDENDRPENSMPLSNIEYQFIKYLLYDKEYDDLVKTKGLMLTVLIDSINEKLFDMFNDTVIIYDSDKPELIDDYIEELRGIIRE